jgi:hypothetical protein
MKACLEAHMETPAGDALTIVQSTACFKRAVVIEKHLSTDTISVL